MDPMQQMRDGRCKSYGLLSFPSGMTKGCRTITHRCLPQAQSAQGTRMLRPGTYVSTTTLSEWAWRALLERFSVMTVNGYRLTLVILPRGQERPKAGVVGQSGSIIGIIGVGTSRTLGVQGAEALSVVLPHVNEKKH